MGCEKMARREWDLVREVEKVSKKIERTKGGDNASYSEVHFHANRAVKIGVLCRILRSHGSLSNESSVGVEGQGDFHQPPGWGRGERDLRDLHLPKRKSQENEFPNFVLGPLQSMNGGEIKEVSAILAIGKFEGLTRKFEWGWLERFLHGTLSQSQSHPRVDHPRTR